MTREIPYFQATMLLFCLLYKHTSDNFCDDFPKISKHFLKISEDSPTGLIRADNRFQPFSVKFLIVPKISEDNCRFLRKNQ